MKSNKGQSLVEFALTLPVLVFILLGIIDFGRYYYVYLTLDNAGRETARAASIGVIRTEGEIRQYAVNSFNKNIGDLFNHLKASDVTPPDDFSGSFFSVTTSGHDVGLKISYDVALLTPFLSELFEGKPLINTTKMRVE